MVSFTIRSRNRSPWATVTGAESGNDLPLMPWVQPPAVVKLMVVVRSGRFEVSRTASVAWRSA